MKLEVKIPSVGESIVSGVLTQWLKTNGDTVSEGESLFEIETDKATVEVPAPGSGRLEILVKEDQEVKIGRLVAYIDTDIKAAKKETAPDTGTALTDGTAAGDLAPPVKPVPPPAVQTTEGEPVKTSPAVRRIAAERILDLKGAKGTGKDQRVTKGDLLQKPAGSGTAGRKQTVVKMSPLRRTIAAKLVQARREAAHLTTFNEINMEHVVNIRRKFQDEFIKKYGTKLGFMSFFVKAACQALKEFPDVNTMVNGNEIIYSHYYDIGVAVSVDQGLLVPVLRDADQMHFAEIEARINELAQKARDKKIALDELRGGTFTITNGGVFGSMMSTPIPNHPQTAILGMHAIQKRPYVVDERIEIKPLMYVALTYDHRVIDGRDAVGFLVSIKKYIEDPESLLIEL